MKLNKQQTEILQILKQRGSKGMNSYEWRMKYIQLPVRIKELKEKGYGITTRQKKDRSVDYILITEPKTEKIKDELVWIPVPNPNGQPMMKQEKAALNDFPRQERLF